MLAVCLIAAGNAGCTPGNSGPLPPTPVVTTFNVPASDAEPPPPAGTDWDVLSVKTTRTGPAGGSTYTNIAITLTFMQTNAFASLPPPGGSTGTSGTLLGLLIFFDADQNSATGSASALKCNGFSYGTGFDHFVDGGGQLFAARLADGNFQVAVLPGLALSGEATVTGSGNTVTITVPISALGGNGQTNMVVFVANVNVGLPTDCVPDASVIQT